MRKWMIMTGIAVLALGSAYLAGFYPQWRKAQAVGTELSEAHTRIADLERAGRFCELRSKLLRIQASFEARNYGIAQEQAQSFFAAVHQNLASAGPEERTSLLRITQQKATLLDALAADDPSAAPVSETLIIIGEALGDLELGAGEREAR